jgi:hypothetical protein
MPSSMRASVVMPGSIVREQMPEQSLTAGERKRLFALLIVARAVTNRELREQTGLTLEGGFRERLNALGYAESTKSGRAFVHELTGRGQNWCQHQLSAPLPERDPGGKLFQALLNTLDRYVEKSGVPLLKIFQPAPAVVVGRTVDVDDRIRAAYGQLTPGPGAWVRLAHLRKHLGDVVQADLDAALVRLNGADDVMIAPDSIQRGLTREDRDAAVRIGGEERHLLKVGPW